MDSIPDDATGFKSLRPTQQMRAIYVRVCRDSGWKLDWIAATKLTASVLGKHPMDVWTSFSSSDVMQKIANGEHPACHRDNGL